MARVAHILLVDDDPEYPLLFETALQEANIVDHLEVVRDGAEAIKYLAGEGPYADRLRYPVPIMVVLDLRMPRVGGFELLRWIRSRPQFCDLHLVVFTGSANEDELGQALSLGADFFGVKPFSFRNLVEAVHQIYQSRAHRGNVPHPA